MIKRFFRNIKALCKYTLWRIDTILWPDYEDALDPYKGNIQRGE